MSARVHRKPTRAYVRGLIGATLILAVALVVMSWGGLGLALDREPVESEGTPLWLGIVAIGSGLVLLGVLLWRQTIATLRGNSAPLWGVVLGAGVGSYLIWCVYGVIAGLTVDETWLSPFGVVLAPIWAISVLVFWGVLVRHVYTDMPTPQWPWEKRQAEEWAAEDREMERRERENSEPGESWEGFEDPGEDDSEK